MNPKVDQFLSKTDKWREEFEALRNIVLECGLNEELKWGQPCYTLHKSNIVLIHGFKEYCALLFFKGALLSNADGLLIQQTDNVQSARQIRFTNAKEISEVKQLIKNSIFEAIEVEKAGLKVEMKKTSDFEVVEEFQQKLDILPALKIAFEALTPGRQRAYLFHFSEAKQAKTRVARVEKYIPQILKGKGIND
ncbi:MAG: YdeI family protein [Pedobacter sp.]|uniref:YdeI/OmpD-associated family protein n=1 Tax=Pedobacter sp. TaxID=1411316 RepID=UPI0028068145|nr:YdeI family protein [Pedobacter sp.]MDQ8004389.1 YdeI family protein [Pedobacter sp.]